MCESVVRLLSTVLRFLDKPLPRLILRPIPPPDPTVLHGATFEDVDPSLHLRAVSIPNSDGIENLGAKVERSGGIPRHPDNSGARNCIHDWPAEPTHVLADFRGQRPPQGSVAALLNRDLRDDARERCT